MVEELSNSIECIKNRFGNRTIDDCKNVTFEKVELSKIDFVKKKMEISFQCHLVKTLDFFLHLFHIC